MFSPIHIFKEHQSYLRKQLVWTWRSQTHFHYNQSTNNVDKPTILFQKKEKKIVMLTSSNSKDLVSPKEWLTFHSLNLNPYIES